MSPRPLADHGTTNRWRTGCRCEPCRAAHSGDSQQQRRTAMVALSDPVADQLFADLAAGVPLRDAALQHGLTSHQVYGRATWDTAWAARLDAAQREGRDPTLEHGTATAYRHGHCRCPDCRATHHPQP